MYCSNQLAFIFTSGGGPGVARHGSRHTLIFWQVPQVFDCFVAGSHESSDSNVLSRERGCREEEKQYWAMWTVMCAELDRRMGSFLFNGLAPSINIPPSSSTRRCNSTRVSSEASEKKLNTRDCQSKKKQQETTRLRGSLGVRRRAAAPPHLASVRWQQAVLVSASGEGASCREQCRLVPRAHGRGGQRLNQWKLKRNYGSEWKNARSNTKGT